MNPKDGAEYISSQCSYHSPRWGSVFDDLTDMWCRKFKGTETNTAISINLCFNVGFSIGLMESHIKLSVGDVCSSML